MRAAIILIVTALFFGACAPNPHGLEAGMKVQNIITEEIFYISNVNRDGWNDEDTQGYVTLKDANGEAIMGKYPIHEYVPVESTIYTPQSLEEAVRNLEASRLLLVSSPSDETRVELKRNVELVETELEQSGVFTPRKWNPKSGKYE